MESEVKQYKRVLDKMFKSKYRFIEALDVGKTFGYFDNAISVTCFIYHGTRPSPYKEKLLKRELLNIFYMMGFRDNLYLSITFLYTKPSGFN